MKRMLLIGFLVLAVLVVTALPTFAFTGGFYSGTLDSSDASMDQRADSGCGVSGTIGSGVFYYETDTFTVPADAMFYGYTDFYNSTDIFVALYPAGMFDPTNPAANCVITFDDYDQNASIAAGTYTLVVTPYTEDDSGSYEFALGYPGIGEGNYTEASMAARPDDDAPSCGTLTGEDEDGYYYDMENFTPVVSGPYTYYDLYEDWETVDMWLVIYQGAFDPENPLTNCVANFDDDGEVFLQAGVDYTIVATTYDPGYQGGGCDGECESGDFAFVFMFTGDGAANASADACPYPLPAGAVVHSIPGGPATYWAPDLQDGTNFNLPAGQTWYVFGTSGDFSHVWIACRANPVWVLTSEVVP